MEDTTTTNAPTAQAETEVPAFMMQYNDVHIEGQCVDDSTIELVTVDAAGRQAYVENFTVASNRRNSKSDSPIFIRVSRWYNDTSTVPVPVHKKGDRIDVYGTLDINRYHRRHNNQPLYACDIEGNWANDANGKTYPVMESTLELRARRVVNRTILAIRMIKAHPELLERDVENNGTTVAQTGPKTAPRTAPNVDTAVAQQPIDEDLPF
jgi:hypothetical protein